MYLLGDLLLPAFGRTGLLIYNKPPKAGEDELAYCSHSGILSSS